MSQLSHGQHSNLPFSLFSIWAFVYCLYIFMDIECNVKIMDLSDTSYLCELDKAFTLSQPVVFYFSLKNQSNNHTYIIQL